MNDQMIEAVLADTAKLEGMGPKGDKVEVISAYDGLELTI
jgi:hypothetical protein